MGKSSYRGGFFLVFCGYIFNSIAKNNGMDDVLVYGGFVGAVFLFFPIFLTVDGYMDLTENKLFFSLKIFKFIKILGGYIVFHKEGEAIHISKKKAIFRPYSDMKEDEKKFKIFKGFQLYTFRASLELGDESFPAAGLYVTLATQILSQALYPLVRNNRVFMELKNGVLLLHGENALKVTVHFITVFNQLAITIAVVKNILEGIINLWQKKKDTKRLKA